MENLSRVDQLTDSEIKELIFKATEKTPNDADLGGKIRALYNRYYHHIEGDEIFEIE